MKRALFCLIQKQSDILNALMLRPFYKLIQAKITLLNDLAVNLRTKRQLVIQLGLV